MPADLPPDSEPSTKTRAKKSQLKVVFDTNALYTTPNNIGSASDLVRREVADLISENKHADLEILWYLPEIVRHERQYQMQAEALKLRQAINRIERLLDHNLALTDQVLLDHVRMKIEAKEQALGLQEIRLDHSLVDWRRIMYDAAYRNPPFENGEREKGFRDALVAESFLQLLATSPKTPSVCRVVLVTSDLLLTQSVKDRIAGSSNASVLASVEELKGLINTVASNVGEDFIAQIKPKAARLFFVSAEQTDTLMYKEELQKRLREKFRSELETKPTGTTFRINGTWFIDSPNFSKKVGRRVFWKSRIEINVEAGIVAKDEQPEKMGLLSDLALSFGGQALGSSKPLQGSDFLTNYLKLEGIPPGGGFAGVAAPVTLGTVSEKRVVTQRGTDIFEVLWSTEVTVNKKLKKPIVEDISHVELKC